MSDKSGIFQITGWDEKPYKEDVNGGNLTQAVVSQQYSGAFTGQSEIHYLMAHKADKQATFVGHEHFTGQFLDVEGELVLQHDGVFENGVASSDFVVITSSIASIKAGDKGTFSSTENGQANYSFE